MVYIMSRTKRRKAPVWYHSGVPSWFKRMNRRDERTQQNQSLRQDKEVPIFRKRDAWDYW